MNNSVSKFTQAAQISVALATGLFGIHAQAANFLNGDFATGDTQAWATTGAVGVQTSFNSTSPFPLSGFSAFLTTASLANNDDVGFATGFLNPTPTEVSSIDTLEPFLGIPAYGLDVGMNAAYEGSAMSQKVTLAAGDKISFNWWFATADTLLGDYAFVMINGQKTTLADFAATSPNGVNAPLVGATTANTFSYFAPSAGSYIVAVGVVDVNDCINSSILGVDNFSVQPVPEPAEYAMLLAGLGLVGFFARNRRSKSAS